MGQGTASGLMQKDVAVEGWIDRRFFRPLGIRLARALEPTRATPNAVTFAGFVVGALGGHLFVYERPLPNALGMALTILADVIDSADGQLARLRGAPSRWGRVLDGYADSLRWAVVYVHLLARALRRGGGARAVVVALAAAESQRLGAGAIDFAYSAYLVAARGHGDLDLPEDSGAFELPRPWWGRTLRSTYRAYARRQAAMMPCTAALIRRLRASDPALRARFAPVYAAHQAPTMRLCSLLGQNTHLALLGAAALLGRPTAYFWGCLAAGTPILAIVLYAHELRAEELLSAWEAMAGPERGP